MLNSQLTGPEGALLGHRTIDEIGRQLLAVSPQNYEVWLTYLTHSSPDLRQAVEGSEFAAEIPGQGTVRVRIPKGADSGSTMRVPAKGSPGINGGPPGDLVIETEVRPHPHLRREGLDLSFAPLDRSRGEPPAERRGAIACHGYP